MVLSEYYEILGLKAGCSVDEIKKAYRNKARIYHPDVNHSSDAKDQFIKVTEAYDFLITNHEKALTDEEDYIRIMNDWRKYRQERSRQRAQYYARKSFSDFKNSKYYQTTRILNGTVIIFNFAVSIMVLTYTILGYILKLRDPVPEEGSPIYSFILLLILSLVLLSVSFIYLKAFLESRKKKDKKK